MARIHGAHERVFKERSVQKLIFYFSYFDKITFSYLNVSLKGKKNYLYLYFVHLLSVVHVYYKQKAKPSSLTLILYDCS